MEYLDVKNLPEDFPYALWLLGGDTANILWVNGEAEQWLGRSKRAQQAIPLTQLLGLPDDAVQAYARCRNGQSSVIMRNCHVNTPNGQGLLCHLSFFPTQGQVGLMLQTAAAAQNDQSANLEAMSAMGRMLAHEIKNPLAGMSGAVQLLKPDVKGEEARSLLNLIGGEIERIRRLVDRMESLGEQDPGNMGLVNVHEVLRRAAKVMSTEKDRRIKFTERYDPSLPPIRADEDLLMQAVLNLIKNSVEAIENSGQGGEIKLETLFRSGVRRRRENGELSASLPIEIRISDDGPGIPKAIRKQIFQPFISNKPAGQGLGLAMVSKIITANGGIIETSSHPGETVFSILLPLHNEVLS